MKVLLISAFRNSSPMHVRRWFDQVFLLSQWRGIDLHTIAIEGDSRDDSTRRYLEEGQRCLHPITIAHFSHGGPHFGSIVDTQRFEQLSKVGDFWLRCVADSLYADVAVFVESDLIWDPGTMADLALKVLETCHPFDVIAPAVFAGGCFYDVWGFRGLDGAQFAPFFPYHSSLSSVASLPPGYPVEVSSVGSCVALTPALARAVPSMSGGAFVGWCANVRAAGYRIAIAPSLRIHHPA